MKKKIIVIFNIFFCCLSSPNFVFDNTKKVIANKIVINTAKLKNPIPVAKKKPLFVQLFLFYWDL